MNTSFRPLVMMKLNLEPEAKRPTTRPIMLFSLPSVVMSLSRADLGWQNFMTLLAGNLDLAMYYMDKLTDSVPEQLKKWLRR